MNFLVLSDSHRNRKNIDRAVALNRRADAILFLGDGIDDLGGESAFMGIPVFAVRGNCDVFSFSHSQNFPEELSLSFEGRNILMMHGHRFGVKISEDRALSYAYQKGADILLFGHTHIPTEKYIPCGETVNETVFERGMYLFNPGSIGQRTDGEYHFGTLSISPRGILFGHGKF